MTHVHFTCSFPVSPVSKTQPNIIIIVVVIIIIIIIIIIKVKFTPEETTKALRGSRSMALPFL